MNRLARILRSRGFRAAVILPAFLAAFLVATMDTARACWSTILSECFMHPINTWPWDPPGEGTWRVCCIVGGNTYCTPSIPPSYSRWGVHSGNFYDILLCPDDDRSLWCYGYPVNHDPEFDVYPASYDTYVEFGPFSLATATACQVAFRLWNESEVAHDSIFWGASTVANLTNASMKIDSGQSDPTANGWETRTMDLSDLRDFITGDSVSMLGQPVVYVFWRFRSDPNQVRHVGSFIDNVVVAKDDGLMDLAVPTSDGILTVLHPDTTPVSTAVQIGDTLWARYGWNICDGGIGSYPPFRVMLTAGDQVIVDTVVATGQSGDVVQLYSPQWYPQEWGEFIVRLKIDTLEQVTEGNENNNADTTVYSVLPPNPLPEFHWITPGSDTLWADSSVTLRWFLSDPDEPCWVSLFYSINPISCSGTGIPGGANRPGLEGEDSLTWDTRFLPSRRTYYLYGQVFDSEHDTCIYAAWPVYTCHNCPLEASDPAVAIPEAYFLSQNYPNPFNPLTEIRYGIAVPGHVTLRVYNLLGQEQATLVNTELSPGTYVANFDGSGLTSGLYMYVLATPEGTLRQKMMLLR